MTLARFATWWDKVPPVGKAIIVIGSMLAGVAGGTWKVAALVHEQQNIPPQVHRLQAQVDTLKATDARLSGLIRTQSDKLATVICMLRALDEGHSVYGCPGSAN